MAYKHNLDGITFVLVCLLMQYENAFATQVPRTPWFNIVGSFAIVNVGGEAGTAFNMVFPGLIMVVSSSLEFCG
jgi:uncharacterized membrane protein YesL